VGEDDDGGRVIGRGLRKRLLGQATSTRSALGSRSAVANAARASATIVVQPSSLAAAQSASAVSTAP
jgi:hypothetical protein